MIAPDKITIYADKYGSCLPHYDSRPSLILSSALKNIGRVLNVKVPDFSKGVFQEYTATLDRGSIIEPPISEPFKVFEFSNPAKLIFANPLVAQSFAESSKYRAGLLHGCHVVYRNNNAKNSQKMALFGDSYCGVDQSLLTGLVAQTLREVRFFWSNSIDYGYTAETKPDIV